MSLPSHLTHVGREIMFSKLTPGSSEKRASLMSVGSESIGRGVLDGPDSIGELTILPADNS